jgi:hypothetical protein
VPASLTRLEYKLDHGLSAAAWPARAHALPDLRLRCRPNCAGPEIKRTEEAKEKGNKKGKLREEEKLHKFGHSLRPQPASSEIIREHSALCARAQAEQKAEQKADQTADPAGADPWLRAGYAPFGVGVLLSDKRFTMRSIC